MESIVFWSAVTAYAIATVAVFVWAAFRSERAQWFAITIAGIGLIPHAVAIGLRWAEVGHGPFSTRYEVLSANAFLAVAVFLVIALMSRGARVLGVVVFPAAFLIMGWAQATFDLRYEVPIIFRSYWLYMHMGFAKLFFVFSLLAGAAGLGYLVRRRTPERLAWAPEPERLDLYGHQFLLIAFLCLGVMIVAGSLWANQSWGRYWAWDPIETAALAAWIVYGIILHFRVLYRWSGTRMAWLHIGAFGVAVLTVYIVVMVLPTIHNFYMVGPR